MECMDRMEWRAWESTREMVESASDEALEKWRDFWQMRVWVKGDAEGYDALTTKILRMRLLVIEMEIADRKISAYKKWHELPFWKKWGSEPPHKEEAEALLF